QVILQQVGGHGVDAVGGNDVVGKRRAGVGLGVVGIGVIDDLRDGAEVAAEHGRGGSIGAGGEAVDFAQPFVEAVKPEPVLADGSADGGAEIIALEVLGCGGEEV